MSIFLDFDGTITAQDTVSSLAKFALGVRAAAGEDLAQEWDGVVRAYVDDHTSRVEAYSPAASSRSSPAQEVAFLRQLKGVEKRSLGRIHRSQVFRGIEPAAFRAAGAGLVREGTVVLRAGFRGFVERRLSEGWRVWVLSVNWSSAFIEGACGGLEGVRVIANDIREDGAIAGPEILNPSSAEEGDYEPRILTNSRDKLDAMEATLRAEGLVGKPSVYFGDSTTDLECLLATSQGFVVADQDDSSLLKTLVRIGKEVPHVRDQSTENKLAWTSNYENIPDDRFVLS
ncbi:haloacid dehalogenase-like hydrolase-domain-containing protein [Hypoxylon fragiforme]|uniref:haloacid dehalogenase-like hydrolase-domain-containing protein n=1 Tax=Hypoxylon fragiforme TaxID=63214 RepID=UPI0020C673AB|nr:haloacid dehalogenase-like hydrolase-domain-containing protein [Hypoxylon fragiforme]KAI2607554.1 haloacid dehalogenase-like hydrolase-domain-containing protein [Hypoxylon fragiforme]